MTYEQYIEATGLIKKIESLNFEIAELEDYCQKDVSKWIMEIRPTPSFSPIKVNHCGLLTSFLQTILDKKIEELKILNKRLEDI